MQGRRGVLDHSTSHAVLYPVHQLVGLAAVQQSSDGWKWVKNDGLWVSVNIILQDQWNRFEQGRSEDSSELHESLKSSSSNYTFCCC